MSDADYEKLEQELKSEKCALQDNNGELERIVAVEALKLSRPADGKILVQIGKAEHGKSVKPQCVLPGTKRSRGEMPHTALQRVLDVDVAPLSHGVTIVD